MDIRVGDRLKLKKQHPCGSYEWEILRVGMDFRMRCAGCGHQVMMPRKQAEKYIRQIVNDPERLKKASEKMNGQPG